MIQCTYCDRYFVQSLSEWFILTKTNLIQNINIKYIEQILMVFYTNRHFISISGRRFRYPFRKKKWKIPDRQLFDWFILMNRMPKNGAYKLKCLVQSVVWFKVGPNYATNYSENRKYHNVRKPNLYGKKTTKISYHHLDDSSFGIWCDR